VIHHCIGLVHARATTPGITHLKLVPVVWRNQTGAVRLLIDQGNIDLSIRNNASLLAIDLARKEEIHTMLKYAFVQYAMCDAGLLCAQRALVDLASVSHHMLVNEEDVSIHSSSDVDGTSKTMRMCLLYCVVIR
jgi:hypothetical protein